jgi:hypothetical protein
MGLIASIFTYLSAVTALVLALLMSFDAFLYPPGQATFGQQKIAVLAKPRVSQPPSISTTSTDPRTLSVVTEASLDDPHSGLENTVSQRPRVRRFVRQARPKDWASRQEPKAFGYAEEPSASFLYDRFQ